MQGVLTGALNGVVGISSLGEGATGNAACGVGGVIGAGAV